MAAICLRDISKSYGENQTVLRDVNLDIDTNEFCVFLGPSGCGKSTLLRIIAGLDDPTGGQIFIGGKQVNAIPPAERGVAMVFQSYALFPHMTVADNIGFGLKLAKTPPVEINRRVKEAAGVLQLEHLLDRKPKALSGGQRQRVAIGRAIVREPGVFLFDEPLSNLDAALRGQTRVEIARLHERFSQASTVYVTHDQVEAMTLADKIVLLNSGAAMQQNGSIAQVGAPLDLYLRPSNRFVAGFIGSPQMNFLSGVVMERSNLGVTVKVAASGDALLAAVDASKVEIGQEVTLGIRPEHLLVNTGAPTLSRPVSLIERLGEQTYLHLADPGGGSLMAKVQGNSECTAGDVVGLVAPAASCHLFTADGRAVPHLQ